MLEADAGDDRDIRIDDVDRVKTSPEAHLEHRHVDLALAENPERREDRVFEVGERHVLPGSLHDFEGGDDLLVFDFNAIDADTLVEAHEVWRQRGPHGPARGQQQAFQENRRRALSVCAGHHEIDRRWRIETGTGSHLRHVSNSAHHGFRVFDADAVQPACEVRALPSGAT